MYIKLKDSAVEKYPYSIQQLRLDNPNISFPSQISETTLAEYSVFPVQETTLPVVDHTKNIIEGNPTLTESGWVQTWEVSDASYDEQLSRILALRAAEYPPMSDYLDGIVKGDQAQVDKYIADCLAVKAKYPKPLPPG